MMTDARLELTANANLPIVVTPSGMVTEVIWENENTPSNSFGFVALFPGIATTGLPIFLQEYRHGSPSLWGNR